MTTLAVRQSVQDYDSWKTVFDGHEPVRRSHGATGHRVLRAGNDVLVLIEFPDESGAQSFGADLSLRDAMHDAGVVGTPDISLRSEASKVQY